VGGFRRSLDAATGSVHVITGGVDGDGAEPRLGAWLHAGAALDSRAHPFIHYDPEAGATWARRFDLADNPQPDADWPIYELPSRDEAGDAQTDSVAFTFADFMLLEPAWRDHFRVIPPAIPDAELTPLADHLEHGLEASETLPFLWAAGADGAMHRLLVDRELVRACRDRRGYWRTLQELAGIRNEHVREAAERERERLETAHEAERTELLSAHAAEIEQVREEASRTVLERLARTLMGSDVATLAAATLSPPPAAASAPTGSAPPEVESAPPATPEAEASPAPTGATDDVAEEPWINSALCTSCNDCLDINPRLFVYNANKQAIIGNPEAGTYAQLVQAAEKCPARCIHPGLPLAPDEPGLEALIERARPFNG
jgi:ferredoxin